MLIGFAPAVLIIMIFQYCAKLKPTKSLVSKKVDLCSPLAGVGGAGKCGRTHCTPPPYGPVIANVWSPYYSYYYFYKQAKRQIFFFIDVI